MALRDCRGCGRPCIRTIAAIREDLGNVPALAEASAAEQPSSLVPTREAQLDVEIGYLHAAYARLIAELLGHCHNCHIRAGLGLPLVPYVSPTPPRPRSELTYEREDHNNFSEVA